MANPDGILNGTKVPLLISTTQGSGYVEACGRLTNTDTLNTELIDITNTCSEEKRSYLAGEGLQSVDITLDILHSDDPGYDILVQAWVNRSAVYVRQAFGSWTLDLAALVPNMALTAGQNESVNNSITINSTGDFTLVQ